MFVTGMRVLVTKTTTRTRKYTMSVDTGLQEIKTVPYAPLSHRCVERPIGTIRRECLDRTLFWTSTDLEMKLLDFQGYYNGHRTHAGLAGRTPDPSAEPGRDDARGLACLVSRS